ncbi:efflux RND transporter periplasmic adaptor subunit [Vibrio hippocampi]|uniref:Efflux pump periplasmic linker BepF n=1 Tax=Vibrio hippocampi TaxID=654686 RepID=A0ABN8DM15_9VIBR|nr:efflux RND transporter periplasmic adaptor subunit [Vibrio hippocampi]CAH0529000.1 Efflux pump periplasmic linker BepF [Vibrio hippocampi]
MNKFWYKTTLTMGVIVSLSGCNQQTAEMESAPVSQTKVQVIQLGDLAATSQKHFSGVVKPHEKVDLSFRVPGTINNIAVKAGDSVVKGQLIAQLDDHDYQVVLQELEAKMLEAQSAHKLAKAELQRVQQAAQDDAIAQVNLDRAISGYERSQSAIKVVEKNIQRAKDTLAYTHLYAPYDGVVGRVNFDTYEQTLAGVAVATIQDNKEFEIEVDVPESLIHHFEMGQTGTVSWYQSDVKLDATVAEIAPLPHLIKQTYPVTYRITQTDDRLFSGKSVSLTADIAQPVSAHCIPYSAIAGDDQSMHINVVRYQHIEQVPVELEFIDAYQACVFGDLKAGEHIVVSGTHYLSPGDMVEQMIVRAQ